MAPEQYLYPYVWLTSLTIIENLSTCKEIIALSNLKNVDIFKKLFYGFIINKPPHYFHCINYCFEKLKNTNTETVYVLLYLALFTPMKCKESRKIFEKLHPSWRFIDLVEAADKVGSYKMSWNSIKEVNNDLNEYISKILDVAELPSVFEKNNTINKTDYLNELFHYEDNKYFCFSETDLPIFLYVNDMNNKINELTENSISTRFLGISESSMGNVWKSIRAPFQIMGNQVFRPSYLSPSECDNIFFSTWRGLVEDELFYGENFEFSKNLMNIFSGGLNEIEIKNRYLQIAKINIDNVFFENA